MQFNKVHTNSVVSGKSFFGKLTKEKKTDISRILSPIPPRPSKIILAKSKFYNKNLLLSLNFKPNIKSYAQAFKDNISKIIKIREAFPKLSSNKVLKVHRVINKLDIKDKPKFNMTTKSLSCK